MFGILLYDGVEPIDVGAAFGVLSIAKRLVPELAFTGIARQAGPVHCANGLVVHAEYGIDDCPPLDDLIVTGGPGWTDVVNDARTIEFIRHSTVPVTSLCTGALILDAAHRLDGRSATTKVETFPGEISPIGLFSDKVRPRVAAVVEDDDVVTSGGILLGLDAMFRILERRHGKAVASETARVMEYTRALEANQAAFAHG